VRIAALTAVSALALAATAQAGGSAAPGTAFVDSAQVSGSAEFSSESGGTVSANARTVPTWSGSFSYGGRTWPYAMVGTDPAAGPARTVVPAVVVPLDLRFRAGLGGELRGGDRVAGLLASPIFRPTDFSVLRNVYVPGYGALGDQAGPPVVTQYGDAVQKAMFWQTGGSAAGYDVLLGDPTVLPPQSIDVPAGQGYDLVGKISGKHYGLVDEQWFQTRVKSLIGSLQLPPEALAIFVSDSAFLYEGDPSVCCVIGYHGASSSVSGKGKQPVATYVYAAYSDAGVFASPKIADVHAVSHEVAEWYADPFVTNVVPPWSSPTAPFYGCVGALEPGDPVVGHGFDATPVGGGATYHPEDEAYVSWFARETPSRGFGGRYTLLANPWFTGVAGSC
jgi:hypothetical protein